MQRYRETKDTKVNSFARYKINANSDEPQKKGEYLHCVTGGNITTKNVCDNMKEQINYN